MCIENIISALLRATTYQIKSNQIKSYYYYYFQIICYCIFRIVNVSNTSSEIGHVENKWELSLKPNL